jgi:hypothetical protein
VTDDGATTPVLAPQGYSGRAVAAICLAIAAVTVGVGAPVLGTLLGALTIALALSARRSLREGSTQQGWGVSLAAMIIGTAVIVTTALSTTAPILLTAVSLLLG